MTNLTRKNQKVFASGATNNGQFGSLQATTKVLSSDIETLQALAAYEAGWNSAAISGEQLPSLEEFQALNYINTYQSAYLLQKGLPEWVSTATYYDNDIQRGVGNSKLYKSKIDDNINYDVAATAYDGGTTYAIDDVASDTNGDVYRSLTDSNTGNPLSDGSNWELTWEYMGDLSNLVNTAYSLNSVQTFTSSGTYTPTAGTRAVMAEVQAAGGGGGGSTTSNSSAGGGAGGYSRKFITSGLGATETVTIGSGGAGGASGGLNVGSSGSSSSFGSHCSATGGGGASFIGGASIGGAGGVGSGGDINITGSAGTGTQTSQDFPGGNGGASMFGGAGRGNNGGGGVGTLGGGGGGGSNSPAGGAGGAGLVVIYEYK